MQQYSIFGCKDFISTTCQEAEFSPHSWDTRRYGMDIISSPKANRNCIHAIDEIGENKLIFDHPNYGYLTFNHLGLLILKKLAHHDDNCLLPKIIDFTHSEERLLKNENEAIERIGGIGGVLKELFNIFFKDCIAENQKDVTTVAGEALAMLALESKNNYHRILKLKVLERLIDALKVPLLRVNDGRILTNLCTYSGSEALKQLRGVIAAAPTVLQAIMSQENKLQEVMIGLAASVFTFMTSYESSIIFEESRITEDELPNKLSDILKKHRYPPTKVSRIRRAGNLDDERKIRKHSYFQGFRNRGGAGSFNVFSATMGLNRHNLTIHSLVETTLKLVEDRGSKGDLNLWVDSTFCEACQH
ncbi:hypothetical protein HKD37_10G027658 [Glycine soja]